MNSKQEGKMKIHEPLEERAVSWVSLAGSPAVHCCLHQGCSPAEPYGCTQCAGVLQCLSDVGSLFHVFENDGLLSLMWSRSFLYMCCKPAICPGEWPEPSGSHHSCMGIFDGFVFCSDSQVSLTINQNKSNLQVEQFPGEGCSFIKMEMFAWYLLIFMGL